MGHLYQGRYKSFPVQDDAHYLTVLRYIEANPLRAGLIEQAEQWPWSSLAVRRGRQVSFKVAEGPVDLPKDWGDLVQEYVDDERTESIVRSLKRSAPLGDSRWTQTTAAKLKLESTLRPRGRPRKEPTEKGTAYL